MESKILDGDLQRTHTARTVSKETGTTWSAMLTAGRHSVSKVLVGMRSILLGVDKPCRKSKRHRKQSGREVLNVIVILVLLRWRVREVVWNFSIRDS